MLNQIVIVGRIVKDLELINDGRNNKVANLIVGVPRSYKNDTGEYDTDFIDCTLLNGIAENTVEYCRKGDLVGIKGRLEVYFDENETGIIIKSSKVIAEKVTFLSSKNKEEI